MIRFRCEHCREWLTIAETPAGETGRCPLCRQTTRIPPTSETLSAKERQGEQPLELLREPSSADDHESQKIEFYCETQGPAETASPPAVRRERELTPAPRARLIDVLLYPMTFDGLGTMVILALGLWIVRLFPTLDDSLAHDPDVTLLMVVWYLFLVWLAAIYFGHCVFDSAKGGTHAPDVWSGYRYTGGQLPSVMLMGAVVLCLGPAALCCICTGSLGLFFWMLALAGTFPLPMLLLACTLIGDAEALNPALIVTSITAALPAYLGLIAKLGPLLLFAVALYLDWCQWGLPRVFLYAIHLYLSWIAGHLLGRFYLRQKHKLGWDL